MPLPDHAPRSQAGGETAERGAAVRELALGTEQTSVTLIGERRERSTMSSIKQAAAEFLANKRIAVTGVSRQGTSHGANIVYQRLRERGYQVVAINPNSDTVEGDPCYHDLKSVPGGVDAVVIGTRPEHAEDTMRECADLGIRQVWMHRAFGNGSVSPEATEYGRAHAITVIDGGCPLMFEPACDRAHKFMRAMGTLTGKVPRHV